MGCRPAWPLRKAVWKSLSKQKLESPNDPTVPPQPSSLRTATTETLVRPCSLLTGVCVTVARKQDRLSCPSNDGWIMEMWFTCTMGFYPTFKKDEIMQSAGKWKDLQNIIFTEVTQITNHTVVSPMQVSSFYFYICVSMWA